MDKNTYETYEYLPTNSNEAEPDQFFVVQGDGTFLLNRQIQYVTQVEDVKEVLENVQPCTVYGVSPQQFFVDVDNSSELVSVSDQFILPDGENNLYTNTYLLQPSSSTTTEQITLSDEQYQTLEQKGWVLLESNDKIFVLNTLGLHDITSNDKLIQKLRNEIQNNNNGGGSNTGILKIENVSNQFPNIVTEPLSNEHQAVEFVINEDEQNETVENVQFITDTKENIGTPSIVEDTSQSPEHESRNQPVVSEEIKQETYYNEQTQSIKIKTKFVFKDIPDKILLGKSINGKRLIAKVIQPETNKNDVIESQPADEAPLLEQIAENQHYNATGLHEADFVNLIQMTLRAGSQSQNIEQDIASADTVISQLLKVPNLKQSLIGHNLIVTKASNSKDQFCMIYNRSKVTLITGRVKEKEDTLGFEHLPNLLQSIKMSSEKQNVSQNEVFNCIEENEAKEKFTIFHIHITETKCSDNVVRVSVTLNKRQLPVSLIFHLKKRYPNTVFGCSACATLFKSEEALKEHQQRQCLDTEDMLTIDSDHSDNDSDDVIIMKTGKETVFSCAQCNIQFTKLSNIHRHMKTHRGSRQQILQTDRKTSNIGGITKKGNKVYKCKMCPSTYYHSASLSKHIVNRHIKVKSN